VRDAGSGVREGGGLMAAEYLWGMCIDEFEKPVQVESFKPSQVWEGGAEGDGWVVLQLPGTYEANRQKYSGQMRKTEVKKALPRESSGGAGERASKGIGGQRPPGFYSCPFRPFGPTKPPWPGESRTQ